MPLPQASAIRRSSPSALPADVTARIPRVASGSSLVSPDGHDALALVTLRGPFKAAARAYPPVAAGIRAHPSPWRTTPRGGDYEDDG